MLQGKSYDEMSPGERIKFRRIELDLSAEKIADSLGISPATIYRYENGDTKKIPPENLEGIARILQTTPNWIMGWKFSPDEVREVIERHAKEAQASPDVPPENMKYLSNKLAADAGVELFAELSAADLVNVRELCTLYNSLNDAGKSLLMTTAESFAANPSLQQAPPAASVS